MKKLLLFISTIFILCTALAQAPINPALENNIARIDSLTEQFYSNIPSHTPFGDSFISWNINKTTFQNQMALLGSSIAFPYNDYVGSQIRGFLSASESYYGTLHKRMQLYFPVFEQILDKNQMPKELKYVSVIESALNPNAVSWCGATGLWQFMPYTGRGMNMRIDYTIDERKSIVVSTEKACEYFRNSYNQFGDWLLAIASYNCGAGNVQAAINRAGGVKNFWKIKPYLPMETQNYVPRFIAAAYVLNFTKLSNFDYNCSSLLLVPTKIDSTLALKNLALYLDANLEEITSYNRQYLTKNVGAQKEILLPYDLSMAFMDNADSIYAFNRKQLAAEEAAKPVYVKKTVPQYHYVKKGQTLYSIARTYGVTIYQIKVWNKLRSNYPPVGKNIIIYRTQWVNSKTQTEG